MLEGRDFRHERHLLQHNSSFISRCFLRVVSLQSPFVLYFLRSWHQSEIVKTNSKNSSKGSTLVHIGVDDLGSSSAAITTWSAGCTQRNPGVHNILSTEFWASPPTFQNSPTCGQRLHQISRNIIKIGTPDCGYERGPQLVYMDKNVVDTWISLMDGKKSTNPNFSVRILSGGVGVFHVKGWGPKSSICPSKPRK